MKRCVLIPDAGTGAANSLVRSLRAAEVPVRVVGCSDDRFALTRSAADANYLTSPPAHPRYTGGLARIVRRERVDLLMPNTDADVRRAARLRRRLPCRLFLPSLPVIDRCQDKYALTALLRARGVPAPRTFAVRRLADVAPIFRRFGRARRLWCRLRTGAGSMGALPVASPAQARAWMRYWREMRHVAVGAFTLSDYLPGRDFACQSLWKDGRLVLVKTAERLAYHGGERHPSGVSSIAALARAVVEPHVAEIAVAAVRALGRRVSGAFSVDLKEDARGVPNVTEINAGRFITMMNLFDLAGKHSMAATYVRLALDEPVGFENEYDAVDDRYFVRDVDNVPGVVAAHELFEAIHDARVAR